MVVPRPFYTYSFGSLGGGLRTATGSDFFRWFHLVEVERQAVDDCATRIRFRPEGGRFRDSCYLDAISSTTGELICLLLALRRRFVDGGDGIFAQDLVKSFLLAALPDACQSVLADFVAEMAVPNPAHGQTPGFLVFRGDRARWRSESGWSLLMLANVQEEGEPWLSVQLRPNPDAPNARSIASDARPWWKRMWSHAFGNH